MPFHAIPHQVYRTPSHPPNPSNPTAQIQSFVSHSKTTVNNHITPRCHTTSRDTTPRHTTPHHTTPRFVTPTQATSCYSTMPFERSRPSPPTRVFTNLASRYYYQCTNIWLVQIMNPLMINPTSHLSQKRAPVRWREQNGVISCASVPSVPWGSRLRS